MFFMPCAIGGRETILPLSDRNVALRPLANKTRIGVDRIEHFGLKVDLVPESDERPLGPKTSSKTCPPFQRNLASAKVCTFF